MLQKGGGHKMYENRFVGMWVAVVWDEQTRTEPKRKNWWRKSHSVKFTVAVTVRASLVMSNVLPAPSPRMYN